MCVHLTARRVVYECKSPAAGECVAGEEEEETELMRMVCTRACVSNNVCTSVTLSVACVTFIQLWKYFLDDFCA